jgi:hypothetical protein
MESDYNDYQLRQGEKTYVLSTCIVENAIRLTCKDQKGKQYSRDFSVSDLKSIDPIFNVINSEKDAIDYIDKALGIHKVAVFEESGILKIVFYVTSKGLFNAIEIPLAESDQNLKVDNTNSIEQPSSELEVGVSNALSISAEQIYGNTNINAGELKVEDAGVYENNDTYNLPNIGPVTEDLTATGDNFNADGYLSQYQTSNAVEGTNIYGTTDATNYEEFQNYTDNLTDNNQYVQPNYDTTNITVGADNLNSFPSYVNNVEQNTLNSYTTSNDNYNYNNNYDTTSYEVPSTTYGSTTQINEPYTYESKNYQYNEYTTQPIIESTTNEQVFSTYETSTPVVETLPTITPADQLEPTTLEYNTNSDLMQANSGFKENDVFLENVPQYNTYSEPHIIETKTFGQKPVELEYQKNVLEAKPLEPEDTDNLNNQTLEINSLRNKIMDLSSVKSQIAELQKLKQQACEIDLLKKKLDELRALHMRKRVSDTEMLKRKIEDLEKINMEYAKEISYLRKSVPGSSMKDSTLLALGTTKVMSENKLEKEECVKGEIIHDMKELELITKKINKQNKKLTINLLYKATVDSDKASAFHEKCDDAKSTIVFVETDDGKRFGGYTSCSWSGDCIEKEDEDAFVFSLDKMKTYDNIPGEEAIGCYPKFGPIFLGCQIRIYDDAFTKGGTTYEKGLNYSTEEDYELTDGKRNFNVKEIEVYEVIPH